MCLSKSPHSYTRFAACGLLEISTIPFSVAAISHRPTPFSSEILDNLDSLLPTMVRFDARRPVLSGLKLSAKIFQERRLPPSPPLFQNSARLRGFQPDVFRVWAQERDGQFSWAHVADSKIPVLQRVLLVDQRVEFGLRRMQIDVVPFDARGRLGPEQGADLLAASVAAVSILRGFLQARFDLLQYGAVALLPVLCWHVAAHRILKVLVRGGSQEARVDKNERTTPRPDSTGDGLAMAIIITKTRRTSRECGRMPAAASVIM